MPKTRTPEQIGAALRNFATHHNHGEGWSYARQSNAKVFYLGLEKRRMVTRLWQAARTFMVTLFKKIELLDLMEKFPLKDRVRLACSLASMDFENRGWTWPDGEVNGNLCHWEEDGEYIQLVGPTVGEKVADFLEQDPNNPHAIAIAAEIERIFALARRRRKEASND